MTDGATVAKGESDGGLSPRSPGSPWRRAARNYLRRPVGALALVGLLALVAIALEAGRIASYPVNFVDLAHIGPGGRADADGRSFFGTDYLGRDLFSQTMYGLRTSLLIALMVAASAAVIGVLVGGAAGYLGGWGAAILMRGVDVIVAVPVMVVTLVAFSYSRYSRRPTLASC